MMNEKEENKKDICILFILISIFLFMIPFISAVNISSCRTINQNSELTTHVRNETTCFTINASNIVLDCQGYSVNYSVTGTGDKYGVNLSKFNNVTIKNCVFVEANASGATQMGIYAQGQNNTIYNNTINTSGANAFGIVLEGALSTNVTSNTINTSGDGGYGIYLTAGSNYSTIINNNITNSYTGIYLDTDSIHNNISTNTIYGYTTSSGIANRGIQGDNASHSFISYNIINASGRNTWGIVLQDSNWSTVFYNTMRTGGGTTGVGNETKGFYSDSSYYLNVSLNFINTSSVNGEPITVQTGSHSFFISNAFNASNSRAMLLSDSINLTIRHNNFTNRGADNIGVRFVSVNSSLFSSNRITTLGSNSEAINLASSFTNAFSNNIINTSGSSSFAYYFGSGTNNNVTNDNITIMNSSVAHIFVTNGTADLINLTFNRSNIEFFNGVATGSVNVKWFVTVNATGSSNVTAKNASNHVEQSLLTNNNGQAVLALTEFMQNGSSAFQSSTSTFYRTPHNISATKSGYTTPSLQTINLTQTNSTNIAFTLLLIEAEAVTSPATSGGETTTAQSETPSTAPAEPPSPVPEEIIQALEEIAENEEVIEIIEDVLAGFEQEQEGEEPIEVTNVEIVSATEESITAIVESTGGDVVIEVKPDEESKLPRVDINFKDNIVVKARERRKVRCIGATCF